MEVLDQHYHRLQLRELEIPCRQGLQRLAAFDVGVGRQQGEAGALRQLQPFGEQPQRFVASEPASLQPVLQFAELLGRRVGRLKGERLLHQFDHRPERGAGGVGTTPALEPGVRLIAELRAQLVAQARFPDARIPVHDDRLAHALDHALPRICEHATSLCRPTKGV